MSERCQEAFPIETPIAAKAVTISYAVHDAAEPEAWAAGKADPDWRQKLEAIAEEAIARAHRLEDSLVSERPTTLVDALILVSVARNLVGTVATDPSDHQSERSLSGIRNALDRVARLLGAETGKSLEALGLATWADWAAIEREDDAPPA